ncbi:F-box protein AFR [Hirschfeldia incana]|nr:F-box protein AFR [Hirschfeldia incana]
MTETQTDTVDQQEEETKITTQPLIPGLPNEIAELCLLRLPYPYHALFRSVSSSWNATITSPSFLHSKQSLSNTPYLFVFSFNKSTAKIQWQSLDLSSGRWFVLPPMPSSFAKISSPHALSCASIPRQGKLFVLGGGESSRSAVVYTALTNRWSLASPMLAPRTHFVSGNLDGKIVAVGGSSDGGGGEATKDVETYDPENDTWKASARLPMVLAKYDSAVIGKEMLVTEGWAWPFMFPPMGQVYDLDKDTWREMSGGMKEGWTGVSVVIRGRLFVISEHGDCPMKVYSSDDDTWRYVSGDKLPRKAMRRPFAVAGVEDRVYVVGEGLSVAEGRVSEGQNGEFSVEWRMMVASSHQARAQFSPASCHVLYV